MTLRTTEEAKLYIEETLVPGEIYPVSNGHAGLYSSRSPDKESPNEDSAALIPFDGRSGILVVADGLGGMRAGEQASGHAVRTLKEAVEDAIRHERTLRNAILNGIEKANQDVSGMGVGAGTTLAVVEIQDNAVRPYHIGDTMILVVGQKGKVKLQTVSHSPVGYAVEAGLLNESDAMNHEERHLVSNMIGTPDMRIEVGSWVSLAPRDTLLLASDGLFDNLHLDEIKERVRKGSLSTVLDVLAQDCHRRMEGKEQGTPSKPDDLTFIVYRPR